MAEHRDVTVFNIPVAILYYCTGQVKPYEVLGITVEGRYELKRIGKNKIVKAAKEQLRPWPIDWCLSVDMNDLLELIENEGTEEEEDEQDSCFESETGVSLAVLATPRPRTRLWTARQKSRIVEGERAGVDRENQREDSTDSRDFTEK